MRCGYTVIPNELKVKASDGTEVSISQLWSRRQGSKFNGVSYPVQRAAEAGLDATLFFVSQMADIRSVAPNDETHPAFGAALREAAAAGVHVLAVDCYVTPKSMTIGDPVEVRL